MQKGLDQMRRELDAERAKAQVLVGKSSDYGKAIETYTALILKTHWNPIFYMVRGELLAQIGEVYRAIGDAGNAISKSPRYYEAYRFRSTLFLRLRQESDALKDIEKLIELSDGAVRAGHHHFRARIYLRLGEEGKAIGDFDAAVVLLPRDADLRRGRAKLRAKRWDLRGAIEDYSRAIRFSKATSGDYHERGWVNELSGNVLAAIDDYRKAYSLAPGLNAIRTSFYRLRASVLDRVSGALEADSGFIGDSPYSMSRPAIETP